MITKHPFRTSLNVFVKRKLLNSSNNNCSRLSQRRQRQQRLLPYRHHRAIVDCLRTIQRHHQTLNKRRKGARLTFRYGHRRMHAAVPIQRHRRRRQHRQQLPNIHRLQRRTFGCNEQLCDKCSKVYLFKEYIEYTNDDLGLQEKRLDFASVAAARQTSSTCRSSSPITSTPSSFTTISSTSLSMSSSSCTPAIPICSTSINSPFSSDNIVSGTNLQDDQRKAPGYARPTSATQQQSSPTNLRNLFGTYTLCCNL